MQCSSNAFLRNISDICLESPDETFCFPERLKSLSVPTSIWCMINAFVGFCGNLLTLLAIPYAAKRRRFNLHRNWNTNLYILNLAFADLLYCMVNLPLYSYSYLTKGWSLGSELCKIATGFRYVNAFADWMSLAMIALSRCFLLTNPGLGQKLFAGKSGKILVILIWIYANLLLLPLYVPQLKLGTFGYNCRVGKCDFLPYDDSHIFPRVILYGVGFSIPCVIVTLSYLTIWYHIWSGNRYLKKVGHQHLKKMITKREMRTNWTLFMVCFCYFLFVSPIALVNMVDPDVDRPEVHLGFFCLYWLQYSLNFFIYAARSEQFKKAYVFFLKKAWAKLCCRQSDTISTTVLYLPNKRQIPPEMVSAILESLSQGINFNPSKLALPGSLASSFVNGQAIIIMRQRGSRRTSDVYRDRAFRAMMGLTTKDKDDESCSESGDLFPSQVLSVQEVFRSHFMRRRASSI